MAWERRRYRGHKVWILVDEAGGVALDERGLGRLRYKPPQGEEEDESNRTYTVQPTEIHALETSGARTETATIPPIEIWVHVDGPDPDGATGIGIVLQWGDRRREIARSLTAADAEEARVAAVLEALGAVRKPTWPVRIRIHGARSLEGDVRAEGPTPQAAVAALRRGAERFADLAFEPVEDPPGPLATTAAARAREEKESRARRMRPT